MPNVKGAVLTDRDRALLAYVGIARYASADQVHRLIAPDRSKKLVYRRLAKLCLPGGRPGEGACLRRLHYRRYEGTSVPVWALTPYGRSLVTPGLPWLPAPASDVGARFLEHTLLLNDVLLELVVSLRRSETALLEELPFRWRAENDEVLQFRAFGHHLGESHQAVLKPDAILEVPGRGRRLEGAAIPAVLRRPLRRPQGQLVRPRLPGRVRSAPRLRRPFPRSQAAGGACGEGMPRRHELPGGQGPNGASSVRGHRPHLRRGRS